MISVARRGVAMAILGLVLFPAAPVLADRGADPQAVEPNVAAALDANAHEADPNAVFNEDPNLDDPNRLVKPNNEDDNGKAKNWQLLVPIGLLLLLFVFMGRKPRKEQKKREEMLANLKKGDKITSIGGIVGTIVEMRENEITVKVDESSNTRMKFARWAIRTTGAPSEQEGEKKE